MTNKIINKLNIYSDAFNQIRDVLNERNHRLFLAETAVQVGYGTISILSQRTGVAISTIRRGIITLAELAKEINKEIEVIHYPPGTSKYNKVERRPLCYITKHWQGKPLVDVQTAVNLIQSTTTENGLLSRICVFHGIKTSWIWNALIIKFHCS